MKLSAELAYNVLADRYDTEFHDPIDRAEDQVVFLHWLRNMGAAERYSHVLDLGCGTGLMLEYLPVRHYIGVDVSERMLQVARTNHFGRTFLRADMEDLHNFVMDESIDLAVSTYAFSYAKQPWNVVQELYRVLKPGGRFFILCYGRRYQKRPHYILSRYEMQVDTEFYRPRELYRLFSGYFHNTQVWGFNCLGDRLYRHAKEYRPQMAQFLLWEAGTIGRMVPSLCYSLIVTGGKQDGSTYSGR